MQRRLAEQTEQIDELTDKVGATMSQLQTLMQDIEMMDEHYARAYARCQHLTDKLKQRTEEIAALKLEMSELKAQLAYQKRAVAILQDAGDSSESQAVQLIEQCTEMSTDLERIHTKVDSLNGICATNSAQLDELRDEHEARTEAAVKRATSMNQLMQQQTAAIDSNCGTIHRTYVFFYLYFCCF
ncbi:unnamed protein product [Anisakis simplex]|uniref:t-SNARE coiled-coil homology domain-containing protein n=1 Tax=Anisakis simplex TaxID=6269 RepID=A0A0M3J8V8_ANISI|nr:unnamed protein product [Anisakis simplex]